MSKALYQRKRTASQLAALTLANAFIFQEELAGQDARVKPLRRVLGQSDPIQALVDHWEFICDEINYVPIFYLARQILLDCPARKEMHNALRTLGDKVLEIVAKRAALRHDLMGRIYHRLLLEAKYLGTYYTSVPAATLLAKLTFRPRSWPVEWDDVDEIGKMRVADLACGTGTLLMACQQAITDNLVRARAARGDELSADDLRELHRRLMEDVLYGYDVLSSAVHLTASTLALLAPDISFDSTNLVCLPLGVTSGGTASLGSIEFLHEAGGSPPQLLLTGAATEGEDLRLSEDVPIAVRGKGGALPTEGVPKLDVCIMNPPFTRSVGGNLLFGSLPSDQRRKLQKKLKELLQAKGRRPVLASATAGLGSVFVAVGDVYVKPGGRLSLVLPAALGFGAAWEKTRTLLDQDYVVEFVVSSHDPERWNFSENTSLSELLVVARKRVTHAESGPTTFVNLWHNPRTPIEALGLADLVRNSETAPIFSGDEDDAAHGVASLVVEDTKVGEVLRLPWRELKGAQWYPAAFAQTELVRAAHHLRHGRVWLPTEGVAGTVTVVPLGHLGKLGPDARDIHDGFTRARSRTPYPALWGHKSSEITSLAVDINSYLEPLPKAKKGRPLREAKVLWPRSGRVMIAERMRLTSQALSAVRLPEYALSNTWWPFRLSDEDSRTEKALVLWLNSTLGTINTLAHRSPTEGPWIKYKKPMLQGMLVLDVVSLSEDAKSGLAEAFDRISADSLRPLAELMDDVTRDRIDESLSEVLGLGSLHKLKEALGREPVVTGVRIERPPKDEELQIDMTF